MQRATTVSSQDESGVLDQWSARKLRPIILLYVAVVFAAFMVPAYFMFHSLTAVKALAFSGIGGLVSLFPSVIAKVEYRLSESGLATRPVNKKNPGPFKNRFQWDQLSHFVATKNGFKYHKLMNESKPIRRFWKSRISDEFSGEIHVEIKDRERILQILELSARRTTQPEISS
jgi:hypothetical protein